MTRSSPLRHALALGALVPFLGLAACGHETAEAEPGVPVAVDAVEVRPGRIARRIAAVGTIRSERSAVLAGKVMGTVVEIRRAAGDAVRRGEVIVVLDHREVDGQVAQAEGALAQARAAAVLAERNEERFRALFEKGAASRLELDQARYQRETARGAVAQAEGALATASSYLRYAEIPAPFDGQVVDRMVEVGDMAAPGVPLVRVEDGRRLRLHATLPEGDLRAAREGAEVEVFVPAAGDAPIRGVVAEVVPSLDPATRTALVKIALPDGAGLRSGLYGRAAFRGEERAALLLPRQAVRTRGGLKGVFAVEDGRAAFRLLTVRDLGADSVEVVSGLSPGDQVIVAPPATLEIGQAVEVRG